MKIRPMTRCAVFAAAMTVCSWLAIPLGELAVSLQTFALFLTLGLLGGGQAAVVCLVYLSLGALGLPVFTGFQGGLGHLLGPTGGYLWGFLVAALIFWAVEKWVPRLPALALALLGCYACGTVWYAWVYAEGSLWAVLLKCVVPYLLPDGLKLTLAWLLIPRLKAVAGKPME